jgi:hypothetical protein
MIAGSRWTGCGVQIKVVSYRMWGLAMNAVSVLRTRTVNSRACDHESRKRDDAERECRPLSLLSFLEAENIRLRGAVVELLIDILALRGALQEASAPWRGVQAKRAASVVPLLLQAHDVAVTAVAHAGEPVISSSATRGSGLTRAKCSATPNHEAG